MGLQHRLCKHEKITGRQLTTDNGEPTPRMLEYTGPRYIESQRNWFLAPHLTIAGEYADYGDKFIPGKEDALRE